MPAPELRKNKLDVHLLGPTKICLGLPGGWREDLQPLSAALSFAAGLSAVPSSFQIYLIADDILNLKWSKFWGTVQKSHELT